MAKIGVGADYVYWFARETTFGTAVAASPTLIPTEGFTINHDYKSHIVPRATGLRVQGDDDAWQDTNGSIPDTSFSFFVSQDTAALFPAVLQYDTDFTAAVNVMTLSAMVDYDDLPDFSNDEGYFYTIQAQGPAQAYNERLVGAVGNSLKLSVGPDANEGALYAEMAFIAKESSINSSNYTGTPTTPSMASLYKWSDIGTFTVNSLDVTSSLYDWEITITNSAKPVPYGGGANMALPKVEGSGSFKLLGNDSNIITLKGLCGNSAAGASYALVLEFGDGTVSEADEMNINAQIKLTNYSVDKPMDGEETVTFEYTLVQDSTTAPFTLSYYTA